jgi:hypothetical protein
VRKSSSWIQTLGYLPLNVMQNRLVKHKIVGGAQRFRSARDFDPMATAMSALSVAESPEFSPTSEPLVKGRSLRIVGA